jgi:ADP-ribose pyrophosphatase YjhB (NUDIX family)
MWNLYARGIKVDEPIISLVLKHICRLTKSMRKVQRKTLVARPTKEVSVMAWIEDANQNILLVRQAAGLKLWTLPGGKVKRGESLLKALKREVYEETGLRVQIGSLLGVLDRRDKDAITLLFAALPDKQSIKLRRPDKEIQRAVFQPALPKKASPSAKYFWSARRGAVKKPPKIRASTHQFPSTPAFAQPSS